MADDNADIRDAKVVYTTKELFARIDDKLEKIEAAVNNSPTTQDLEHLHERVAVIEDWKLSNEVREKQTGVLFGRTDKAAMLALTLSAVIISVLNATHAFG